MSIKPCVACGDNNENMDMFQVWPPEPSPPPWDETVKSHESYVITKLEPWTKASSDIIIYLCPGCWRRLLEPS